MERRLNFLRFLLISYLLIYQDTIEAVSHESWYIFHHSRLKAVCRNKVILNINGTVLHTAYKISIHLKMFKRENGYKLWLVDSKIDICRFLKSNYDPIAKLVFNLFKEFTNFVMYVMGFYPRPELLILPFPSGDYMLMIRWFLNNKLTFDTIH